MINQVGTGGWVAVRDEKGTRGGVAVEMMTPGHPKHIRMSEGECFFPNADVFQTSFLSPSYSTIQAEDLTCRAVSTPRPLPSLAQDDSMHSHGPTGRVTCIGTPGPTDKKEAEMVRGGIIWRH